MRYETAFSFWKRLRGVIGKGDDFCPLFIPECQKIHTFWMKTAIDLFWIDEAGLVCKIERSIPPRRVRSCQRAYGVLEAPPKKITHLKIGQRALDSFSRDSFSTLF